MQFTCKPYTQTVLTLMQMRDRFSMAADRADGLPASPGYAPAHSVATRQAPRRSACRCRSASTAPLPARVRTGEQPVFPAQGNAPQRALRDVVVYLCPAVAAVQVLRVSLLQQVGERLRRILVARQPLHLRMYPVVQRLN